MNRTFLPDDCGCKGIRTCLICENTQFPTKSINEREISDKKENIYTYCLHCNLCWLSTGEVNHSLYLQGITVIPDFLNSTEEVEVIQSIDKLPWMPSQSGRKKQDFGPKVNFKKKKGKVGSFQGFPCFSEKLIQKFQNYTELKNFKPVELCNLEYVPERGSAIEPHMDDTWIWGERLVTVNLASSTLLTLTPATLQKCNCCFHEPKETSIACDNSDINLKSDMNIKTNDTACRHESSQVESACGIYRCLDSEEKVSIQIPLPPKSVMVLYGCARNNWFHEIKRQHVTSRRLAMTFRELSSEFLEDGPESKLGNELLRMSERFYDVIE